MVAAPEPSDVSADDIRLAVLIARRYFLEDKSKVAIAEELGLSRFKVARLLDRARTEGIVRIQIANPGGVDEELSNQLAAELGIRRALVADPLHPSAFLQAVAETAAAQLRQVVAAESVLGIAWSRSVRRLTEQLSGLPPCSVVQLCGVLPQPDREEHNVELVRQAARACGGRAVTFYAPLVLPDAATARTLRAQPGISDALSQCDHLSVAVIAVGQWRAGESTVFDYIDRKEAAAFAARGAVAESAGILVAADGTVVPDALQDRVIAVSEQQLRGAHDVLALASDPGREAAIRALTRSGLVTTLVTHRAIAERLLAGE